MARPSKYSSQRAEPILRSLRVGNTRTASCLAADISLDTFARWCERYAEFRGAVDKAEAEAELLYVNDIAHAARDGSWQAAKWWLQVRRREGWQEPATRVEHTWAREQAEQIAAEAGVPVEQVERDIVLAYEAMR